MTAHDRARYNAKRTPRGRTVRAKIKQLEMELAASPPVERDPIATAIDRLMSTHSAGARTRRTDELAEWERIEAEDNTPVVPTHAGNGEQRFVRAPCATEPTEAETEAFLAWERETLGIDRRTGAIRKLGP